MLHCQISTTADLSLLRMTLSRPKEDIVAYAPLRFSYLTPLSQALKQRYFDMDALRKVFAFAQEATSQLGEWCADQVWSFALAEQEALKVEKKVERDYTMGHMPKPAEIHNNDIARLREAQNFVNSWNFIPPAFEGNSLSSKVILLYQYLNLHFKAPSETRCIVFVHRRYTARLLKELFTRIGPVNLRLGLLVGTRIGDPGDVKVSFKQQILTLMKFRKGELNCLFATSIAEEGLDIPDCNIVIR